MLGPRNLSWALALLAYCLFLLSLPCASAAPDSFPVAHALRHNQHHHHQQHEARDVYTDQKPVDTETHLTSVGARPAGAEGRNLQVYGGQLFAWFSKTPHDDRDADSAIIIIHGRWRDANKYFTTFNNIWGQYRGKGSATLNTVRVAPQFFSTKNDARAYNASSLAWGDANAWQSGAETTHPAGVHTSSFKVLDYFLNYFSNKSRYPNMKYITFVGHGGGGQTVSRYAVFGKDAPRAGVQVRYVVGDPSSQLYFSVDRPVPFPASCDTFHSYRYGMKAGTYDIPGYPLAYNGDLPALFRRFAARDVRYVIGAADDSTANGDQTCMARAQGGARRADRNRSYWKYINLLGQSARNADVSRFPGSFPALDTGASDKSVRKSLASTVAKFKGTYVNHRFFLAPGAGHNAAEAFSTDQARAFLFQPRESLKNSNA